MRENLRELNELLNKKEEEKNMHNFFEGSSSDYWTNLNV